MTSTVAESTERIWNNFNLFSSTKESLSDEDLSFEGKVPQWLKGTLYRNGPGANEVNNDTASSFHHAFDGFAFLQKYEIDGAKQSVRFRGSFVKSRSYTESMKEGRLITRQFGTDPCKSIFGRFQTIFRDSDPTTRTDDTGVTIQMINNELIALTEIPSGNIVDAKTLEPVGPLTSLPYSKSVEGEILSTATAHVMYDERRRMTVGYSGRISRIQHWLDVIFIYDDPIDTAKKDEENDEDESNWLSGNGRFLHLTKNISDRAKEYNRRVRANTKMFRFPADYISYMHSASLSENYLILTEIPLLFNVFSAVYTKVMGGIFTDLFKWQGSTMPTYFRIINLDTGEEVARIAGPAFFTFHHINSYESPENKRKIIVDICAFDDNRVIGELALEPLRKNYFPSGAGYLRRFEVDLDAKTCVESQVNVREGSGAQKISHANSLIPVQFELPRINPRFHGKSYRYVYAVRVQEHRFLDALIKLDAQSKEQVGLWEEPCTSPSEPIFVPRPDGNDEQEDDGVVLSVILEQEKKRSFLLVLDAKTFKELARAYLPIHVPLSFHGNYYSA